MSKSQQKWLLIILIVIALNAAIWFFGIKPARTLIDTTERQISAQVQRETQLRQRLDTLAAIDTAALEQEKLNQMILVPEAGLLREMLTELDSVAGEMEIEISNIAVSAPAFEGVYQKIDIILTLAGDYTSLCSYINYLETHSRLIILNNFGFTPREDGLGSNIRLSMFAGNFDTYTPYEAPGRGNPFEDD